MGLLAGKTLADAVAPGDTHLTITPPLALGDNPAGQPIQIGSELMMVTGGKRGVLGLARAADSAHTQGTAITELNRFVASAPSAGGVNVNDTPVTNIVAAGATLDGTVATLRGKDFYAQDDDPGAVGTGSVWKDTDASPAPAWWTRNVANDGWDSVIEANVDAVADAEAAARTKARSTGAGGALAGPIAATEGAGNADARPIATSGGSALGAASTGSALAGPVASSDDGTVSVEGTGTTSGEGNVFAGSGATASGSGQAVVTGNAVSATAKASVSSLARRGADSPANYVGMYAEVDENGVRKFGFNAVAASGGVTIPEIPASPTEQDIVDALVALGLVTQAV